MKNCKLDILTLFIDQTKVFNISIIFIDVYSKKKKKKFPKLPPSKIHPKTSPSKIHPQKSWNTSPPPSDSCFKLPPYHFAPPPPKLQKFPSVRSDA